MDAPHLAVLKTRLDGVLSNLVHWEMSLPTSGKLDLPYFKVLFQPKPFHDSVTLQRPIFLSLAFATASCQLPWCALTLCCDNGLSESLSKHPSSHLEKKVWLNRQQIHKARPKQTWDQGGSLPLMQTVSHHSQSGAKDISAALHPCPQCHWPQDPGDVTWAWHKRSQFKDIYEQL